MSNMLGVSHDVRVCLIIKGMSLFYIFMGKISTKAHKTQFAGWSINIVFIVLGIYNFAMHMHSRFAKIHRC